MLAKNRSDSSSVTVTFTHPIDSATTSVSLSGDFNDWSTETHPMSLVGGDARCVVELPAGSVFRFRYLLDGERWENDWRADAYVPNDFGGDDSVVDLTDVPIDVVSAEQPAAPAKRKRKASVADSAHGAA